MAAPRGLPMKVQWNLGLRPFAIEWCRQQPAHTHIHPTHTHPHTLTTHTTYIHTNIHAFTPPHSLTRSHPPTGIHSHTIKHIITHTFTPTQPHTLTFSSIHTHTLIHHTHAHVHTFIHTHTKVRFSEGLNNSGPPLLAGIIASGPSLPH